AFPAAGRVTIVGRNQVFRVRLTVHKDRAERMRTTDIENENAFLRFVRYKFHSIRSQELSRAARRLAARVRLELVRAAVHEQFFSPGLKRNVSNVQLSRKSCCRRNRKLRCERI